MKESEIKFKVKDLGQVRNILRKLGAKLIWQGDEENFYFDTPKRILKKEKMTLRLRKWEGHSNFLTLKTKASRSPKALKVRNEFQIVLNDLIIARKIVEKLGFYEWLRYKKYREHWKLGKNSIELDKLGKRSFVEVEGSKKEIDKLAKQLGLDWRRSITKSYLNLLTRR